jgi:Flp pilus assembly protein TadD
LRQVGFCRAALGLDEGNVFAKDCIATSLRLLVATFREEPALPLMTEAVTLAREVWSARQLVTSLYVMSEYALLVGDVAEARRKAEQAGELEPRSPRPLVNQAWLLLRIGEPAAAEAALLRSLELPDYRHSENTYGNLAIAALLQRQGPSAVQWARKAVEAVPARAIFWNLLALASALANDPVGARQAAVQALQLDPTLAAMSSGVWSRIWPSADKEAERLRWIEEVLRPAAAVAGIPFSKATSPARP